MTSQEASAEERERDKSVIREALHIEDNGRIAYEDEGWDSRVYIVNSGEAVFKFPRAQEVIQQYRHE